MRMRPIEPEPDDGDDDKMTCQTCGAELWDFQESCPYCGDDGLDDELPCPSCGAMISAMSEKCAVCGDWVVMKSESKGAAAKRRRRTHTIVWILLAVFVFLCVIWATR